MGTGITILLVFIAVVVTLLIAGSCYQENCCGQ